MNVHMAFLQRNKREGVSNRFYYPLFSFFAFFLISCINEDYFENINGTNILSFHLENGNTRYKSFSVNDSSIYVKVPNQCDLRSLRTICNHNGIKAMLDGVDLDNKGILTDYSDFSKPHIVTVESSEGVKKNYSIHLFDLPVVIVNTKDFAPVADKETWIPATMKIIDNLGNNILETELNIKGRGNGSWKYDTYKKKSYSIKLDKKREVLGFPKSKRWVLLGTSADWTKMRTPLCFKLSEWSGYEWSPKGTNVEFILNGKLMCNYYLCEQIRVEKNRIDIQEMTPADTIGESFTGGVLFEVSQEADEKYMIHSNKTGLYFMFKNPNDSIHKKQMSYFTAFIDSVENAMISYDSIVNNEYEQFIDIDSYIRWWLIHEMATNEEEHSASKNFYMYKDRGYKSKLHAGPPWDFDWGTFWDKNIEKWTADRLWFKRLFSNPSFVRRVKEIWSFLKEKCDNSVDGFFENQTNMNRNSVIRDQCYYPIEFPEEIANEDNGMEYEESISYLLRVLKSRILWMDNEINNM